MPVVTPVQPAAMALTANLAAPKLLTALPLVSLQQPMALPVAPAAMRAAALPMVAVQPVQAVAQPLQAGLSARAFDSAGRSPSSAVSIDVGGTPAEAMRGADRETIAALRSFRKGLKEISNGPALSQQAADALLRRSRELGMPIRVHGSDLQARDNHWVRGPHTHIGDFHIPVQPGYVPTLLPGYANPN